MTIEHGTLRGVRWHRAERVPTCPACRRAAADQRADQRKRAYLRGGQSLLVNSCGVQRRLHALQAIGWSATALAGELGVHRSAVQKLMRSQRSNTATLAAVTDLYDRLSMTPGPHRAAARYAAAHGWAPPLAWDDHSIDDPTAQPHRGDANAVLFDEVAVERAVAGQAVRLRPVERREAIRRLKAARLTDAAVAVRLHTTERAVQRHRATDRARAQRPADDTATAA